MSRRAVAAAVVVCCGSFAGLHQPARAADPIVVDRGKYIVTASGCSDCHTPGTFLGHPDMTKYLGGSDVGFAIPNVGVFVGPNLTPDKETGLGGWSTEQIVAAIGTGKTPEGRILSPNMPWRDFGKMTQRDLVAIAEYLKSLPPVSHKVPGPFGPTETPTTFVMAVIPGAVYASMPKPPPPALK
jgi:mono/diheme cytochrome c family protein